MATTIFKHGITYRPSDLNRSQLYAALEPLLNSGQVELLDQPKLLQQLIGLMRKGEKIDHASGEHDDHANSCAGVLVLAAKAAACVPVAFSCNGQMITGEPVPEPSLAPMPVPVSVATADEIRAIRKKPLLHRTPEEHQRVLDYFEQQRQAAQAETDPIKRACLTHGVWTPDRPSSFEADCRDHREICALEVSHDDTQTEEAEAQTKTRERPTGTRLLAGPHRKGPTPRAPPTRQRGRRTEAPMIFKSYPTQVRAVDEQRLHFLVSTHDVDRDNDRIDPRGWVVDNYLRNPVVMFGHDYKSLPVGRCVDLQVTARGLEAQIEFPPRGVYAFADTVHDMVRTGFLNATSVRFRPLESAPARERKGVDYTRQELTEISITPLPSNPAALLQRHYAPYAKALRDWAEQAEGRSSAVGKEDPMSNDDRIVIRIRDDAPAGPRVRYNAVDPNNPLWIMRRDEDKRRATEAAWRSWWQDVFTAAAKR